MASPHKALQRCVKRFSANNLVQRNRAKFDKNCGVYGKSTKFGTMIVYDMANNIGYGPHRDLSHNSKYSRFNFLHQDSSMETRLSQTIPN